jgi:hypothetical protein
MKTKQRLMSAAMVAAGTMLCRVLFAADVAFYPFNEGNDGDNAVGATIQNAANPGTLSGTASQVKADTTATATFLDDVTGRYLYTNKTWSADAIYRSDVLRSIQTSWVTNSSASIISATSINFADLGARLSELDAFTVEFFFKFDEFWMKPSGAFYEYRDNVRFGDSETLVVCLQNKIDPTAFIGVRTFCGGVAARQSSGNLTSSSSPVPGREIVPGIWHHVASTYDRATRKINTILDYTHAGTAIACTSEVAFATAPFKLGNGVSAIRFAALRITDRVLSANELMRASSVPPTGFSLTGDFETRFHWSFESKTPGDSLGTVPNDAPWYNLVEQDYACQYPYAVDGQSFIFSGNGVVRPNTFNYTLLGTLTMGGYASNVTDRARSCLEYPNGNLRTNNVCAFVEAGPKNAASEVFGKGPAFRMSDTNLLSSADFTAETYWMPDMEGWLAKLDNDQGKRYRASVFGVKGNMRDDVPNRINCSYVWCLHFNMNTENFNIGCIVRKPDGTYLDDNKWTIMGNAYSAKCKDGLMHHYAVVYRVSDANNGGNPTVRLYIDHEEGYVFTLQGPIVDSGAYFKNAAFALGAQELNNHPMQGWFDEVRYTARALAPAEFLTLRRPPKGLGLVIR